MRPLRSSFARPPASTGGVWTFIAGGSAGRQSGAQKTALRSGPAPPPWYLERARRHKIPEPAPASDSITLTRPLAPRGRPRPDSGRGSPLPAWPRPRACRDEPSRSASRHRRREPCRRDRRPTPEADAGAEHRSGRPHPGTGRFDNLPREGDPCTERSEAETAAPPSARRRMISASRTGSARGRPSVRTSCAPSFAGRA